VCDSNFLSEPGIQCRCLAFRKELIRSEELALHDVVLIENRKQHARGPCGRTHRVARTLSNELRDLRIRLAEIEVVHRVEGAIQQQKVPLSSRGSGERFFVEMLRRL